MWSRKFDLFNKEVGQHVDKFAISVRVQLWLVREMGLLVILAGALVLDFKFEVKGCGG